MAIEATGVENVMEEVAHFWQLRKFQFIEEATDFWMDAVAPKECLGDEDPNLRTALTLNQFFTEWLVSLIDDSTCPWAVGFKSVCPIKELSG